MYPAIVVQQWICGLQNRTARGWTPALGVRISGDYLEGSKWTQSAGRERVGGSYTRSQVGATDVRSTVSEEEQ